jgi:hypothetical protein
LQLLSIPAPRAICGLAGEGATIEKTVIAACYALLYKVEKFKSLYALVAQGLDNKFVLVYQVIFLV